MSTVLVVAPHPDDEVFGVGGTILRHVADGDAVHVLICTRGEVSRFGAEHIETVQNEARRVHEFLGVAESHAMDFPAARLDTVPGSDLNAAVGDVFAHVQPDADLHRLEAAYGRFERTVRLPEAAKAEGAKASYKNGVLKIELEKSQDTKKKKININVN